VAPTRFLEALVVSLVEADWVEATQSLVAMHSPVPSRLFHLPLFFI